MFCVVQTHKLSRCEFVTAAFVLESEAREYLEREFNQDGECFGFAGRIKEIDVRIEIPPRRRAGRGGGAGVG